jgi:hypothetical protein
MHSFPETREVTKNLNQSLLLTLLAVAAGQAAAQSAPWTYSAFSEPVRDVAFDANGIAYVTSGTTVTRIDPVRREALGTLRARSAQLTQVVPEPGGCRIAFTDAAGGTNRIFMIDSLGAPALREVTLPTLPSLQFGTWSLAWVGPDDLLVSGRFGGSGWARLRRVNIATGETQILNEVRQDSMLSADATRTHVLVAESNISSGPVSVLDQTTGSLRQTVATGWFLWDVPFNGSMAVVPTYFGGFMFDFVDGRLQQRPGVIGSYADFGPISLTFARHTTAVFQSTWSGTINKRALIVYPTRQLTNPQVLELRPELDWTGNSAFQHGRLALSDDGYWLALTTDSAVRFYDVRALAARPDEVFASEFGQCGN